MWGSPEDPGGGKLACLVVKARLSFRLNPSNLIALGFELKFAWDNWFRVDFVFSTKLVYPAICRTHISKGPPSKNNGQFGKYRQYSDTFPLGCTRDRLFPKEAERSHPAKSRGSSISGCSRSGTLAFRCCKRAALRAKSRSLHFCVFGPCGITPGPYMRVLLSVVPEDVICDRNLIIELCTSTDVIDIWVT